MSDFIGYKVGIATKSNPTEYRELDFSKETLMKAGVPYYEIPFNPLAAAGRAVRDLTFAENLSFLKNELVLNVYDLRNEKVIKTAYDWEWMDYELEMEILAG